MGANCTVNSSGLITTAQGISLPTTGGTPTTLNYNEQDFTQATTFEGPWGATIYSNPLIFSRIGKMVTMQWPGFSGGGQVVSTPQVMSSVESLPARFAAEFTTFNTIMFPVFIYSGSGIFDTILGMLTLHPSGGNVFAYFSNSDGSVISTTYAGIPKGAVSWINLGV